MALLFDDIPDAIDRLFNRLDQIESLIKEKVQIKEPDPVLDIKEAASILHLSPQTIYGMVHKREIPHNKKGNRLYFLKSELVKWMSDGRRKTMREIDQAVKM